VYRNRRRRIRSRAAKRLLRLRGERRFLVLDELEFNRHISKVVIRERVTGA
jgi:hypothetical protein